MKKRLQNKFCTVRLWSKALNKLHLRNSNKMLLYKSHVIIQKFNTSCIIWSHTEIRHRWLKFLAGEGGDFWLFCSFCFSFRFSISYIMLTCYVYYCISLGFNMLFSHFIAGILLFSPKRISHGMWLHFVFFILRSWIFFTATIITILRLWNK